MTDISGGKPDNAMVTGEVKTIQSYTEDSIRAGLRSPVDNAWGNAKGNFFGNIIGGIGNAITNGLKGINVGGFFGPIAEPAITIHQGQIALSDRVDLIPLGFCSAYMDRNINLAWGLDNLRKAPFRAKYGPAQGAHVDETSGHIVFDKTGTWTVHALMNCDGTNFSGNNNITMHVSVRKPNGEIHYEKQVSSSPDTNPDSLTLSDSFPIDEPGYYVGIWVWSGRWRWWRGGTDKSGLTVIRSSLNTDNQGDRTVPNETKNETKV